MKPQYYLLLSFFKILPYAIFAQGGQWIWINGSDTTNAHAVYGIQGTPNINNTPAGFYEANNWMDKQGNFWIFGGTIDYQAFHETNDLWKYDVTNNTWTWVKGPGGVLGQAGIYGSLGVPSPTNIPGARSWGSVSWTDNNGELWLFGGQGYDSSGLYGFLNDLWKYNISTNEWTWMGGRGRSDQNDVYGVIGQPSSLNMPGARMESNAAWVDDHNNLWFFGGLGLTSLFYNDMWRFSISTNEWTWMKGREGTGDTAGNYGTPGIEDSLNLPPSRGAYSRWQDADGNFYLWGGMKNRYTNQSLEYSDLWRYNRFTNNWTWIAGDSTPGSIGNYLRYCNNNGRTGPMSRSEDRSAQVLAGCTNLFYVFGGYHSDSANNQYWRGLNDLWVFNTQTNNWIWVSGPYAYDNLGNYGSRGVASYSNVPPSRFGHCLWVDNRGDLYMFGGVNYGMYNDVWKFVPDSNSCINSPIIFTGINYQLSDSSICRGDSSKLSLQRVSSLSILPTTSIIWQDSLHAILRPDTTTSYTITCKSACNEYDTTSTKFTVHVFSPIAYITADTTVFCPGDSTQLCTDSTFASYGWNNGETARCIFAGSAGNYYVTVTDNNSCTAESNHIDISVHTSPQVSISVNGDTLTVHNAVTDQWYFNGNPITNATSAIYIADKKGLYSVSVTDSNGCFSMSNPILFSSLFNLEEDDVKIYPNPLLTGYWYAQVNTNLLENSLEIFDAEGRLVFKTVLHSTNTEINLNAESGIYFMKISSAGNSIIRKLVRL